jgi:hypothetical protein
VSTPGRMAHLLERSWCARPAGGSEGAVAWEAPHLTDHDGQGAGDASRYTSRLEASDHPLSHLAAVGTRPQLRRPARAKSRAAVPEPGPERVAPYRPNGTLSPPWHSLKYDRAAECLIKDREALLAFYDFRLSAGNICADCLVNPRLGSLWLRRGGR